ncbi:MAG: peptidase MA family metallohydrolase [Planctomycetota bacterium]|jgi:hypothetical protein
MRVELGLEVPVPLEVYVTRSRSRFDKLVRDLGRSSGPPEWSMAVAIGGANAVVIDATKLEPLSDRGLGPVVAHELAHLALAPLPRGIPRWLNEGLAMWASGQRLNPMQWSQLGGRARGEKLPTFAELTRSFPPHAAEASEAYLFSLAAVESLHQIYKAEAVRGFILDLDRGWRFDEAFDKAFHAPPDGFEIVLLEALKERYNPWRALMSTEGLFAVASLLAVLAFIRHRLRRHRLLKAMTEAERPVESPDFGDPDSSSNP